jgi:hypothetical protein
MPRSSTNPLKTRIAQRKLYTRSLRHVGLRWSHDDYHELLTLKKHHLTLKQMANQLGRTTSGVSAALRKLRASGELLDEEPEDSNADRLVGPRHIQEEEEEEQPVPMPTSPPTTFSAPFQSAEPDEPWVRMYSHPQQLQSYHEQSCLRNHVLLHMHCDDDGHWMDSEH